MNSTEVIFDNIETRKMVRVNKQFETAYIKALQNKGTYMVPSKFVYMDYGNKVVCKYHGIAIAIIQHNTLFYRADCHPYTLKLVEAFALKYGYKNKNHWVSLTPHNLIDKAKV